VTAAASDVRLARGGRAREGGGNDHPEQHHPEREPGGAGAATVQQQAAVQQQTTVQEQAPGSEASVLDRARPAGRREARLQERDDRRRDRLRGRLRTTEGELRETRQRLREARLREDDEVIRRDDDGVIVRREGQIIILREEAEDRFGGDAQVEQLPNGFTRTVVVRGEIQIVTIHDQEGAIVRRSRILPNGQEMVLIDSGQAPQRPQQRAQVNVEVNLPPLRIDIPREEYIVETEQATEQEIEVALSAPPVEEVERVYSLEEVTQNERVRAKVRRIDLDNITFAFGSYLIPEEELITLEKVGIAMEDILFENPNEIFLVEGHTDAVGSNVANLALSDKRAESVAIALAENFDIPPENLVTQGYGEEDLKVLTEAPERENRRVTLRRITALVNAAENERGNSREWARYSAGPLGRLTPAVRAALIPRRQGAWPPRVRRAEEGAILAPRYGMRRAHHRLHPHGVALAFQEADRVRADPFLDSQLVGQPLVVDARRDARLRDIHAVVDHVGDHLQHGGDDAAAARAAGDELHFAVLQNDRRAHGGERPLARLHRIRVPADQAIGVWHARLGGKVVHLVVERMPVPSATSPVP
jgi:outer membrane protein OmpA-like peptidoglycan-associated protein